MSELNSVPRVAVCLAAYNGMEWLGRQIESILAQTDVDVTLVISVDLSSDGTYEYVRDLARTGCKLIALPYGERFGGAARNFFRLLTNVDFSSYQYVALADQDDIWYPGKLSRAISFLAENGADGYSSNVTAFWDNGRRSLINKAQLQREWDFLFEAAGPGCTYVFRSALAERIRDCLIAKSNVMSEIGLHDWFIYAFSRANGYKWVIDAAPTMLYRQHGSNQVGVNQGYKAFLFRARKVLSGWGLRQAYLIACVVGVGSDPFVVRWCQMRRLDLIWLACHSAKCRRRFRDRILFCFSCLGMAIWSPIT